VSQRDGGPALFVMNADGTDQHRVVSAGMQMMPAWSPDGTQIAVVSVPFHQIYLAAVDGSSYRLLSGSIGTYNYPSWSPDGSRILVSSPRWPNA
jgi:TolB protein